jgi:protein-arginine kinase activator protein McsA
LSKSYGLKHKGKVPETTPNGKPSRAFLEKELRNAVEKQDYRKAARIRKQLDTLDGEEAQ